MKNKKQMLIIIGAFVLVLLLGTASYAFFNYTRTGGNNSLGTGRIYFNTSETRTVSLIDIFPVDSNDLDPSMLASTSVRIVGDTTYSGGEEYLVTLTDVHNTINDKVVPIHYITTYTASTDKTIGEESNSYFTARGGSNNVYTLTEEGLVEEGERILIGFLKEGATGIDGVLTIKAWISNDDVAISDTYNEENPETDTNGTTTDWVDGRVVVTTTEWNGFTGNGSLSFKIKTESNEGTWVDDTRSLVSIMKSNTQLDTDINFTMPAEHGITHNGQGIYTLSSSANTRNPIMYYRGNVSDNNVFFAGYCWKIVRTTDTGGVKIIYNGVNTGTVDNPKCESTSAVIQSNVKYSGDNLTNSLAYAGYMWGNVYTWTKEIPEDDIKFGSRFIYEGNEYKLSGTISNGYADGRHYTCNSSDSAETCATIRYYYYTNYYIELSGGENTTQAIEKMKTTGNKSTDTSSYAKQVIDAWYANHLTSYTSMLEDTVWCNDRSVSEYGGWGEDGREQNTLSFSARTRLNVGQPTLDCHDLVDRYTVSSANGNGMLDYPVGMITADEITYGGGKYNSSAGEYYLMSQEFWSMTPHSVNDRFSYVFTLGNNGFLGEHVVHNGYGIRPMVSLKPGTLVKGGSGLKTDPYIILQN